MLASRVVRGARAPLLAIGVVRLDALLAFWHVSLLSGSRRSRRWRISGVRGMGSLALIPRDPDPTLASETELKLSISLSLPSVPLPSGASGE